MPANGLAIAKAYRDAEALRRADGQRRVVWCRYSAANAWGAQVAILEIRLAHEAGPDGAASLSFDPARFAITTETDHGRAVAWRSATLAWDEIQRVVVEGDPYRGGVEVRTATIDGVPCVVDLLPGTRGAGSNRVAAVVYPTRTDRDTAHAWTLSPECEAAQVASAQRIERSRYPGVR